MTLAYEELIDFIAGGSTPAEVAKFQPSKKVKKRIEDLLDKSKEGTLRPAEKQELEHYITLEHVMRMAKAKARLRAAS